VKEIKLDNLNMPFQFDQLRLSSRQEFTRNLDAATDNWPEKFSWTDGLILLHWAAYLLKSVAKLDENTQEKFWQGFVPAQIQSLFPDLFVRWSFAQIVEYCRVLQSADTARTRLVVKASGDHENPKDADLGYALGDIPLDARKSVLNYAAKDKVINMGGTPEFIGKLARQNDVKFFIQLGRKLRSNERPAEVDWTRVKPIENFLVDNWCEDISRWPALCFFEGKARAEYCALRFGVKCDSRYNDSVRQTVKRLGLLRPKQPKIKKIEIKGDEIRFI
jgi:hypothetical protein